MSLVAATSMRTGDAGDLVQVAAELVGRVGDGHLEDTVGQSQRDHGQAAGRALGDARHRLLLRSHPAQVDDRYPEVLAEGIREVTLVEGAELDQQDAEPLAGHALLDQGLRQLGRGQPLPLDQDLAEQALPRVGGRAPAHPCPSDPAALFLRIGRRRRPWPRCSKSGHHRAVGTPTPLLAYRRRGRGLNPFGVTPTSRQVWAAPA